VERAKFEYNKISDKEDKKLWKMFDRVKNEVSYEFEIEDNPDIVMVRRKDAEGKEIGMGFTKVGDTVRFIDGNDYPFSDTVEARIKFPDTPILDALKKLYEEKENKIKIAKALDSTLITSTLKDIHNGIRKDVSPDIKFIFDEKTMTVFVKTVDEGKKEYVRAFQFGEERNIDGVYYSAADRFEAMLQFPGIDEEESVRKWVESKSKHMRD